jgi:hypothetical protein
MDKFKCDICKKEFEEPIFYNNLKLCYDCAVNEIDKKITTEQAKELSGIDSPRKRTRRAT